jgi:putative phage-type endonuclease
MAGIGGSDVGKILGLSKWGNALSVYIDKTQPPKEEAMHEAAELGIELEDFVVRMFEKRTGFKTLAVNAILQDTTYPHFLANVDRLVLDADGNIIGVLECKTGGKKDGWLDEGVPDSYAVQGQWYLGVTGLPRVWFAALLGGWGGMSFEIREWEKDDSLISDMRVACDNFWKMVVAKTPPNVDCECNDALKELYGVAADGKTIEAGQTTSAIALEYMQIKEQIKAWEKREDELGGQLKQTMKDAEVLTCPGFQLTWKNVTTNRLDSKELQEYYPDIYAQHVKESQSRKFLVKAVK